MSDGQPAPKRIRLSSGEIEDMQKDEIVYRWKQQDDYIEYLEEGRIVNPNEDYLEKLQQLQSEATRKEKLLVMRLTEKEQELQVFSNQLAEITKAQTPGSTQLHSSLLDPSLNLLFQRMKKELEDTSTKLRQAQEDMAAWKFTSDSQTGKRLMSRCRTLLQENQELGKQVSQGKIAQLEAELAIQKKHNEELKGSQDELYEMVVQLNEEGEGMQTTICVLQQQLKEATQRLQEYEQPSASTQPSDLLPEDTEMPDASDTCNNLPRLQTSDSETPMEIDRTTGASDPTESNRTTLSHEEQSGGRTTHIDPKEEERTTGLNDQDFEREGGPTRVSDKQNGESQEGNDQVLDPVEEGTNGENLKDGAVEDDASNQDSIPDQSALKHQEVNCVKDKVDESSLTEYCTKEEEDHKLNNKFAEELKEPNESLNYEQERTADARESGIEGDSAEVHFSEPMNPESPDEEPISHTDEKPNCILRKEGNRDSEGKRISELTLGGELQESPEESANMLTTDELQGETTKMQTNCVDNKGRVNMIIRKDGSNDNGNISENSDSDFHVSREGKVLSTNHQFIPSLNPQSPTDVTEDSVQSYDYDALEIDKMEDKNNHKPLDRTGVELNSLRQNVRTPSLEDRNLSPLDENVLNGIDNVDDLNEESSVLTKRHSPTNSDNYSASTFKALSLEATSEGDGPAVDGN